MLRTLKKQFRIQYMDGIWLALFLVAASLAGIVLLGILMHFEGEMESYFPMGTLLGIIVTAFYVFIKDMVQVRIYFNLGVSMGCTRLRFFVSFYTVNFIFNLIGVCLMTVISFAEQTFYAWLYPDLVNEIDLTPYLLEWGIPAAAVISIASGFCGILVMRYGKKAGGILWVLWMFICIGLPRITDAVSEAPDSISGKVGRAVIDAVCMVPGNLWVCIAGMVSLLALAGSWIMLRKQQVTS